MRMMTDAAREGTSLSISVIAHHHKRVCMQTFFSKLNNRQIDHQTHWDAPWYRSVFPKKLSFVLVNIQIVVQKRVSVLLTLFPLFFPLGQKSDIKCIHGMVDYWSFHAVVRRVETRGERMFESMKTNTNSVGNVRLATHFLPSLRPA